jgi:hypothetical protein
MCAVKYIRAYSERRRLSFLRLWVRRSSSFISSIGTGFSLGNGRMPVVPETLRDLFLTAISLDWLSESCAVIKKWNERKVRAVSRGGGGSDSSCGWSVVKTRLFRNEPRIFRI